MQQFKQLFLANVRQQENIRQKRSFRRYFLDIFLAVVGNLAITLVIYSLHLYPTIRNISLVYLLVVLMLGSTRGLFSAVTASIVAFLAFDFFLVPPLYTLTIGKQEEWLALFIFLFAAIITGQLAAALRLRAEQARQREQETRILYELLRDTNNEEDLDHQLSVIARKVVDVFSVRGVCDCMILLPNEQGKPMLRARANEPGNLWQLNADEMTTVAWVMREGQTVDFYNLAHLSQKARGYSPLVVIRSTAMSQTTRRYLSLIPLKTGQKVGGVLCLLMEEDPRRFSNERRLGSEADRSDPRSTFFWAFVDQAAAMIEHARLRRESLQVEVLQRTDALRAALISSVSHDLRTPLTSIKAAASSLLQDDVQWSDEERHSFAQAIEHEADRLNRLVENLLDMSRIEGGALKPEKEWYPIDELLHDVLGRMQPLLRGRDITTNVPEDLPPVELDYMMIDQVMTNLIENALRYTPTGSPIEISASASATELFLSVADRGPGIPSSDLERIFDKFYRVMDRSRAISATGGTGVGLSVCRGLIEAHGGRIWAANRRGGGAIFRFTLPLHRTDTILQKTGEALS
ncbi:MAG TPA: ATP-binding protein [Ktedonobacteraceae bacterium]|jgi:two-component system sensor histidine kinase KdpD